MELFTVKLRSNILEELHMLELNSLHELFPLPARLVQSGNLLYPLTWTS